METPGTDEPRPTEPRPTERRPANESDASTSPTVAQPVPPTVSPSAAPRPATGPSTAGIPVEPADSGGLVGGDWPKQATDAIVNLVDSVRDRTTGPILSIARGVVYGLFAVVFLLVVGVLFIIAAVRLLDEALPSGVWLPYLILGLVFVLAGALVFRKRNQPAASVGNTRAS